MTANSVHASHQDINLAALDAAAHGAFHAAVRMRARLDQTRDGLDWISLGEPHDESWRTAALAALIRIHDGALGCCRMRDLWADAKAELMPPTAPDYQVTKDVDALPYVTFHSTYWSIYAGIIDNVYFNSGPQRAHDTPEAEAEAMARTAGPSADIPF